MALDENKYSYGLDHVLRDTRPLGKKLGDWFSDSNNAAATLLIMIGVTWFLPEAAAKDWLLVLDHEPGEPRRRVRPDERGWYALVDA